MPRTIKLFQTLMYISIGLGFFLRLMSGEIEDLLMFLALVLNVGFLVSIVLLIATYRKNWPRWAFAALFAVQFVFALPTIMVALTTIPGIIALSPMILRGAALICVFSGEANAWFAAPEEAIV